jgi:ABC-type branched-subunit amino acid transport system substrate-binding protein
MDDSQDPAAHKPAAGVVVSRRVTPRSLVALAAASLLALGAAACGGDDGGASKSAGSGGATSRPFKIGLIAPLTGPVAADGIPMKNGVDMAVKDINAKGGLLGKPIEVVTLDNQSDPALSTQQATKLIRQDKVDYLVGTITGAEESAVGQVTTAAKVPFSSFIQGTAPFCSPYVWAFGETNQMLLNQMIPELLKQYGKKVALVGSDYNFPHEYHAVAKKLIAAGGGSVVGEEYAPLGTSDWQPVVAKLKGAHADWVLSAVVGGDAIAFSKQAQQFGLLKQSKLTGVSFIQEYYPAIPEIANGALLVSRYTEQLPGDANAKFVKDYQAAYKPEGPIAGVAATAYDGMQFIAKAVEAAGTADKAKVIEQLAKTQIDGIHGAGLRFSENQHFPTPMLLTRISEGGKYVPVKTYDRVTDDQPCG